MARVLLVHWKQEEAEPLVERLREWGHEAAWRGMRQGKEKKVHSARRHGAEIVVFDLARMPVYSKYHAELIRKTKSTAHIPFVFVGGQEEKVARLRALYPDETFTQWNKLRTVLRKLPSKGGAARKAPEAGAEAPRQLWQKMGLRSGMRVHLHHAPREFFAALGEVPADVEFGEEAQGAQLSAFFVADWQAFGMALQEIVTRAALTPVWVFYRKGIVKSTELRAALLELFLVDYKICAVNANWAGILVRRRKD